MHSSGSCFQGYISADHIIHSIRIEMCCAQCPAEYRRPNRPNTRPNLLHTLLKYCAKLIVDNNWCLLMVFMYRKRHSLSIVKQEPKAKSCNAFALKCFPFLSNNIFSSFVGKSMFAHFCNALNCMYTEFTVEFFVGNWNAMNRLFE